MLGKQMSETFLLDWFVASLVTATMTLTVSRARVFSFLRKFLNKYLPFLGELVSCPYCLAHWTALFVATAIHFRSHVFLSTGMFNLLLSALALVPPSCVMMVIMHKCMDIIGKNEE